MPSSRSFHAFPMIFPFSHDFPRINGGFPASRRADHRHPVKHHGAGGENRWPIAGRNAYPAESYPSSALPWGYQTWMVGKSPIEGGLYGTIIYKSPRQAFLPENMGDL